MSGHTPHQLAETTDANVPDADPPAIESVSPAITSEDVSDISELISNGETPGRSIFPLILVVVGMLPIGLGVGVALRPKPAPPACVADSKTEPHESESPEPRPTSVKMLDWHSVDDLFRAGDYELALQQYQSKQTDPSLRPSDPLLFRTAVTHEVLAKWDEALVEYRHLATSGESKWQREAHLGLVRVWLGLKQPNEALQILSAIFQDGHVNESDQVEVGFQLAMTLALTSFERDAPRGRLDPVLPWQEAGDLRSLAVSAFERAVRANAVSKIAPSRPMSTELPVSNETTSANNWRQLAERLSHAAAAPKDSVNDMAALLELLQSTFPDHPLAADATLMIGALAFRDQRWSEASERYSKLVDKTAKTRCLVAAYNRGLSQFRACEYRAAIESLGRVIDGAPGHALSNRALMLRGRIGLQLGDAESAAMDFKRVAGPRAEPQDRNQAVALMGLSLLVNNQPMQASQWMFHRRELVDDDATRAAAGFVNSLARMQTLRGDDRERETLFLFRALKALEADHDWLGTAGALLIGRAYREIGLSQEMSAIYRTALEGDVVEPYRSEMKLALAEYDLEFGDHDRGRNWLVELHTDLKNPQSFNAGLRLAKLDFDEHHLAKCVALCRELARRRPEAVEPIRLMGQAFEAADDSANAALCFAGTVPDADPKE